MVGTESNHLWKSNASVDTYLETRGIDFHVTTETGCHFRYIKQSKSGVIVEFIQRAQIESELKIITVNLHLARAKGWGCRDLLVE